MYRAKPIHERITLSNIHALPDVNSKTLYPRGVNFNRAPVTQIYILILVSAPIYRKILKTKSNTRRPSCKYPKLWTALPVFLEV